MQGRVNGAARAIGIGMMSLGAVTGGLLGRATGLRAPIAVAGIGLLLGAAWLLLSPIRDLREVPGARREPGEQLAARADSA
jgi:predicted MFS family arabinose efflux permease